MAEEIINEEIVPIEIVTSSEPKSKPKNYVKKIHENLVDAFGVNEVPDEVTFAKKIKDPKYVKLIHENLVDAFGVKEVPDFDKFSINFSTDLEKKNLGEANLLKSGNTLVPTELQLSSTENNLQSIVNKRPDPFDKNASPSNLARQSFNLKQPKSVTKKVVGVDMMGMPVESNEDIYDENSINTAKEIDKHLEKLGYTKDFASTISRIPEKYKEAVGYTDQELADLYKSDKNEFNKRTSNVIWRENLRDSMMEMADNIDKSDLSPEEKDIQINKINTQAELLNQGAEQYAGDLKNKQYYVGESAKNIKQFITNPEKQKQALEDLALSTADDFGSIEDLEDKSKTALSKNINDYQSVALNYLDQIDPEKAAFYRKYIDIDTKDLQKFQYKGYDQLQKELDEIGLNLVVNNAKNKLKTLSDIAKQQGGQLDPQDYEEYNKLLETANTADARLSKLGLVYPNTVNVDTRSIAQELMGGGSSTLGLAGKNLAYGLGKTGKGFIDVVLSPFRSQQINDNAALEALGIENYVESKTIPTKNQSALSRDLPKITPELDARILAIKNDKKLSQTEKEEQVDQLLQSNRDKWTPASTETSWNLGPNAIFSSVANLAAKLAPFFAIEVLSQGAATPEILPATLASFGRMFSNVLVTSYSEELARAMNEKSANPELDAYGSVLVNSLAYKAAGVGDIVKNIRGAANELGGITAKIISKLEDKAIVNALKNPNSTLKGFLNNAGQVIKEKGLEGVKTAAIFEGVLGAKDVMGGAKVDEEFIKQKALNLLTFSLFNTALGSTIGLSKVGKENKEALFLAATNKDEVLYEAKKALENKQISQSAYNEITQNVEAASKVLEKVPMVDGKGNQLGRKEATELMYLKIKEQYLEDQIKKDTPIKVQEKITKDLAEVQDQIDKVYKGTFIEGIGKPFEGIEARTKKEPKISTEEPIVENKQEVKPTEVDLTSAEKMNASQNRYGIVKDGVEAGFIVATNPENNVVKIKGVTVNEELRGKNIAGEAYVKLAESLAKEGVSLESDSFDKMEPSAARVWEKLADKGLAIKGENSYQFKQTEDIYFNQLHRTEKFDDNASVSTYLGQNKNEKNIFYTLPNKGIISYDEVIPNTNRFTITANAKNDTPADIKNAFKRIEKYLPANHELLENKSISVDGLKVWDKFIKDKKYIKTGEINEVQITPIDKANIFKDLKYTTENKWSGAKFENKGGAEALARVEKYIKDNNLDFKIKLDGDVIKVEVPVLKYKPTEVKVTEEVSPIKIVEKVDIGTPKIEEPIIESEKTTKTPKEVQISKKALGNNYNFSKEFDIRGGDVVATDVLTEVTNRAEKNGVDVTTQRAIEVGLMSKGTPEPTEYNIITAGSHLLNIDAKIAKAQETGNLAEVESLNEQRTEVLSVLRTLGNKAGRNLGLFNLVFQETDRSEIKLTRDYLKKVLKVEVPETIAELEKSNLTAEQKKTVRPYVEKIEKAKASFDAIEKEVNKNIIKINDQEVNAAIEKARAEGKKEGFKEGMKANTSEEKQKKSKQIKDLASQIRRSDELDKFLKGAGPLGNAEKASFIDLGTYKEIVANVLDAVAAAVELGEDVSKAIKKAVDKFKDVDAARLISDVETIMSKAKLPNKQDVMEKILKISKAESATDITKKISDKGLVKDIVNSYLGDNLTNDQVLDAATKELKKVLPNVTREQVADAYAERGQFKKETKAKIENEINQKKADVKRLAVKEAKLKALEAADDYHLEETKEGKKRITSEYEKELDEKIKNLLKEKNNVEKQQKVSKTPKTEQDKIDEINREIKFVKETKSVYNQAIKDPKKASDALIAAREERDRTYAALGLKLEKNAKAPILIERNYQEALKEIENSYLPEEEKNNKIAELKAQRDLDLQGTKQGVVSSLFDDINNYIESNIENSDLNNSLKDVLKDLTPSGEKLDDQINKAYNKLNKLVKDERLTKEEKQNVKEIITDLENNNQLTSDELASKRLKKQWENEIRTAETDIASGNFTKLPSNTYDYRRNDELFRLNKARENKSGQLNRMIADAKEKNRTTAEKAIDLSTKFLVSGIHTTAKVAEAATFKPFMDSMVDLTAGRLTSYITGAPYTSLYSVKKGYKTFTAFKNKEAAEKYIQSLQDKRDAALENLKEAHENGGDIKKADKEFKKADLEYAVSTLYNSIETNVLNSFWQYMKHGATDYDVSIGKSSKKDISEYRTVLGKTGYVLDGWIRMHGAMKSSLSARPEMMKVFSSTLKDFQRKGMELNAENISTAMVLAADAYEAGRLTNKTALSKIISRGKGSEKSTAMRLITKGIVPVSTIAVNLAKRGIDYSTLGTEGFVRLANETKKGMKLNEIEGKTYDGLVSAIKDGWSRIPLKERVYINGVVGRGLFGSAIMLATAYGLQNGMIKYGGTFEDQRKRKIMGSDDEQLKAGEWEFFGKRLPKAASLFLNHLPEFLAVSLIADNYQINQMGGTGGEKFETTIDEVEARLPFQTMAGIFVPGRRVNTLVDRFTRIPIAAEAATLFDEKAEFRDKSDFINRIRGNVGFGIVNPTKAQQKQINEIMKQIRKLPSGTLTLEDEKDIDEIIEEIKNTDFGELEMKKMMEESKKE